MDKARDTEHYVQQGDICQEESKPAQAAIKYKRVLSFDPKHFPSHCEWGRTLAFQGHYKYAMLKYKEALILNSIDPDPEAFYNYGWLFAQDQNHVKAEEMYKKSIEHEPTIGARYNNLALSQLKLGKYQEAKLTCQQGLELDPDQFLMWNLSGYLNILEGKYNEAIELTEGAIKVSPSDNLAKLHKILALYCLNKEVEAWDFFHEIKSQVTDINEFHESLRIYLAPYEEELERLNSELVDPDVEEKQLEEKDVSVRGLQFIIQLIKKELEIDSKLENIV